MGSGEFLVKVTKQQRKNMKKRLLPFTLLLATSFLFAGQGKVRVSCDEKGAYIYVDGKKKAMTGEGFTNILLNEGDHVIKVAKEQTKQYQKYAQKSIFVGAETSVKISLKLNKWEPTPSYIKILQQKDIPKFRRWKRSGSVVKDTKLDLMWQDNHEAKTTEKTWKNAKRYCRNLSLAGYSDWRLPSYNELLTIVDYDRYKSAIMPSFKNATSKGYWSSSENVSDAKYAWRVYFDVGYAYNFSESNEYFVRCVRGR